MPLPACACALLVAFAAVGHAAGQDPEPTIRDVRLRITDEKGGPIQFARVRLLKALNGAYGPVDGFAERALEPKDFEPEFATLPDLPPGDFVLQVSADHRAGALSARFTVPAAARPDLEVRLTRGAQLTGRVVDEQGKPVAGVLVSTAGGPSVNTLPVQFVAMLRQFTVDVATQTEARTDAEGRFRLDCLSHARYRIIAAHPDFVVGSVERSVDNDEPAALEDLRLERGATFGGRVLRGDHPVEGAEVLLVLDPASMLGRRGLAPEGQTTRTDAEGRYAFPQRVAAGTWRLSAKSAKEPFQQVIEVKHSQRPVEVARDQRECTEDLQLPAAK